MRRPRKKATAGSATPNPTASEKPSDDEMLSNDQAAAFLKIGPTTLLTWRSMKRGPAYYKIGRFAYYRVADLKAWMEMQRRDPAVA